MAEGETPFEGLLFLRILPEKLAALLCLVIFMQRQHYLSYSS